MADLHIVCMRPGGIIRGGMHHERHEVHRLEDFSPQQLQDMLAEPELALVMGEPLTEAHARALWAKLVREDEAKADKKTKGVP